MIWPAFLAVLPLQDAEWKERIAALPGSGGDRWYSYSVAGTRVGYIHLRCAEARHEGAAALKLEMRLAIKRGERTLQWKSVSLHKLDGFLTPVRYDADVSGDEAGRIEAVFSPGKVVVGGKEQALPDRLVTTEAEFVLVGTMPLKAGTRLEYNSYETEDQRAKTNHLLEVVGEEEIVTAGGARLRCAKIRHSGKGCGEHFYWVDSDRRVVRALFDGDKQLDLTDEETATGEKR
jgi:hypothetical protein